MKNIYSSTTNLLIILLATALIVFTYLKIVDPKDFIAFLGMVAAYKFGRYQNQNTPDPVTPANETPFG